MNKKFLSAILFGALMVTSTGTFVSCKDYDDDIKNLQTQIDTNKTAIAELQKLVGAGKWVSSISSIENGFTVTMSDGSSHQIKGINGKDGADGKNGAEWTIGEDGFWYVDGEKTENVAVGKNGENGVTAPAPAISENGMWVVYSWDAEKGEFVAEETEIPAAGTSAYAVKANGVYTLFIADENGELQEIALPATSDVFVVSALTQGQTYVTFESAKWNPTTSNKYFKEIVKAFPEIAKIEKKTLVKQGGNLPVLVNPANVELTNEFNFSLQTIKGEVLDIAVANPQKGLVGDYDLYFNSLVSRTAKSEDCIWTLAINPAYDEEEKAYVETEEYKPAALVVENAKGTIVKTAFAYNVEADDLTSANVKINDVAGQGKTSSVNVTYAKSIDLFAEDENTEATPVVLENEYTGYYIIELADELEAEEMGLSIAEDGHTLNIATMPANQLNKTVTLNVIALGLNGSVAQNTVTLNLAQEIAASTEWDTQNITLKVNNDGTYTQNVLWDITKLEFTATQKNQLWTNRTNATIEVSYIDEEGEKQVVDTYAMLTKKADGKAAATTYADWANAGFTLDASDYKEGEYTALIKFTDGNNTVIYSATATLDVKNPELGATYVKLVPGFVDENGVYQITGTPKTLSTAGLSLNDPAKVVTYPLESALILGKGASIKDIIDLDNETYKEEGREDEVFEMHNLVKEKNVRGAATPTKTWEMTVNQWAYNWETLQPKWRSDIYNQLYKTRNIRAMISLFGNPENVVPFDFQVIVKSEIYAEDAKTAITIDETKLVNEFGAINVSGTDADESVIDIKAAITKAISVEGTDKGKTYKLFATGKATTVGAVTATYDYRINTAAPGATEVFNSAYFTKETATFDQGTTSTNDDVTLNFVLNSSNDLVEIEAADLKKFGMSAVEYAGRDEDSKKYYITLEEQKTEGGSDLDGLYNLYATWRNYYSQDGTQVVTPIADDDAVAVELYNKYVVGKKVAIKPTNTPSDGSADTTLDKPRDSRVASVTIKFNDPAIAKIYFQNVDENGVVFTDAAGTDYSAITIKPVAEAPNSVTGGQVKVGMTLTVRDAWGMIMQLPFEVTVKTKK